MINVLSLQSDILGNKTYSILLRDSFASSAHVKVDAAWYHEARTFNDRVKRRLAEVRLPILHKKNRDMRRARCEWATGAMSRSLVDRKLAIGRYDLLHFHTQVQSLGSVDLMRQIPTVITIDMTAYQVSREHGAGPAWTYYPGIAMEKRAFDHAAHIVTFSDWAKKSVTDDHGIDEKRVTVVSPGVRLDLLGEPRFENNMKPRILFVGNDFERKGGHDLLEVFVNTFGVVAELHLMTNNPVQFQHPSVFWHPGISAYTPAWKHLFQTSDIFVLPSYRDCFPNVLQEAAAFGLAVIGATVGGIPEMIEDGHNGFLVHPGDKPALLDRLRILITNPALLAEMKRHSRRMAIAKFDAHKNFSKLGEIFQVASQTPPRY